MKDISLTEYRDLITMLQLLLLCVGLQVISAAPQDDNVNPRLAATSASEFPYQVLISQLEEDPKCGGVLVAEGFILTSATCVLDFGGIRTFLAEALIYGGGTSLLTDLGDVSDAVINPRYTVNPTAFDLALVKYIPEEKGPRLNSALLNTSWNDPCVMSSWWMDADTRPERLVWQPISITDCVPVDPNLLCFTDDNTLFHKNDLGSPVVCGGVLTGLVPRGGGQRIINVTSDINWITEAMAEMLNSEQPTEPTTDEETKLYLVKILQRLDSLTREQSSDPELFGDTLTHINNQIVVPLSYILFAMVIFFFVLLFFIVLFTVVLVYYSRK